MLLAGNMLAHPELPEALIEPCIDVLHVMSPNERDLIRIVVEIISELRDPEPGDEESMVCQHLLFILLPFPVSDPALINNRPLATIWTKEPLLLQLLGPGTFEIELRVEKESKI